MYIEVPLLMLLNVNIIFSRQSPSPARLSTKIWCFSMFVFSFSSFVKAKFGAFDGILI
jgi:hypothetical protein